MTVDPNTRHHAIILFLTEFRAWPKFKEAVAADPVHWNGEFQKLERMFVSLENGAARYPQVAAMLDAALAAVRNPDKPIRERCFALGDVLAREKSTLETARKLQ